MTLAVGIAMLTSGCRWALDLEEFSRDPGDGDCAWTAQWEPFHFDPCDLDIPTGPAIMSANSIYRIDTSVNEPALTDEMDAELENVTIQIVTPDAGGPEAVLLVFESLTIEKDATLRAVSGSTATARPLIIVALSDIAVAGVIDVSSDRSPLTLGAGGTGPHCSGGATGSNGGAGPATGGGGGGGFGGTGGAGGRVALSGGRGGSQVDNPPDTVRGGCRGGHGKDPGGMDIDYGVGGGAVQLSAGGRILVSGLIDAGGSGGTGANMVALAGGGGGGSGGYIGFDAPTVVFLADGVVVANGGGGGGGAPDNPSSPAESGKDGQQLPVAADGGGGTGVARGGDGGHGPVPNGLGGEEPQDGGKGGGGGGVGYIVIAEDVEFDNTSGAHTSPTPHEFL